MNKILRIIPIVALGMMMSCKDEVSALPEFGQEDQLITTYLAEQEGFDELQAVMAHIDYDLQLRLAGDRTFFIANDDAFQRYYESKGRSGYEDFTIEELTTLLNEHLLDVRFESTDFRAGALSSSNFNGNFIVVDVPDGEFGSLFVNNSRMVSLDINLSNGILHEIEDVLDPIVTTVDQLIAANPNYSVFNEALIETRLDSLIALFSEINDGNEQRLYFTVIPESDQVFANNGINNFIELVDFLGAEPDYTNTNNALYQFISYHIIKGFRSISDFESRIYATQSGFPIEFQIDESVKINFDPQDSINTTIELDLNFSNDLARNGIVHGLTEIIRVSDLVPGPITIEGELIYNSEVEDPLDYLIIDGITEYAYGGGGSYIAMRTNNVGDFVTFRGPVMFGITYDVFWTFPTFGAGTTIIDMQVNGVRVGDPLVNDAGRLFVGSITIEDVTETEIQMNIINGYTNPSENNVRIDRIEFIPR